MPSLESVGRSRPRGPNCGRLTACLSNLIRLYALKSAARQVRDAGFKNWDTYSPFPIHGIDKAMGLAAFADSVVRVGLAALQAVFSAWLASGG